LVSLSSCAELKRSAESNIEFEVKLLVMNKSDVYQNRVRSFVDEKLRDSRQADRNACDGEKDLKKPQANQMLADWNEGS